MAGTLRFEVPSALDHFAMLVADDASLSLVEAAASIAQDEHPQLDLQAVLAEIDALAARLKRRLAADVVPLQRLRVLNRFFFHELGFAGNVNHYHDRATATCTRCCARGAAYRSRWQCSTSSSRSRWVLRRRGFPFRGTS
jgi:hypothetical protein